MNYDSYEMPAKNNTDMKDKSLFGILFLIPVIMILIIFLLIPIAVTLFRSFTGYYNYGSQFIALKNYEHLLKDTLVLKGILNSAVILLISTPLTVGTGLFFAWMAVKINKPLRIILCIMFLMVSVTSITTAGINSFLSLLRNSFARFYDSSIFSGIISIIINYLLGIGPVFLIFTVYFIIKDDLKKYIHIALSLQLVIYFLSFSSFRSLLILPEYQRLNYAGYIYDQIFFNMMNLGYSSALLVVLGIFLVLLFILLNGIIWIIGLLTQSAPKSADQIRQYPVEKKNPALSAIVFVILFIAAGVMLYPFLRTFLDSFGSLVEYDYIIKLYEWNSVISLFSAAAVMFAISLLGSIGFAMLGRRSKRSLTLFILITFVLSPVTMLFFDHGSYINETLVFAAVKMVLRSTAVGLSIFFSTKVLEGRLEQFGKPSDILSSPQDILKYLLGTLSAVVMSSLPVWFNPLYSTGNIKKLIIYQLYQRDVFMTGYEGEAASILVLTQLIPISVIVLLTPILILCLERKKIAKG